MTTTNLIGGVVALVCLVMYLMRRRARMQAEDE